MRARDIMTRDPQCCRREDTARRAAEVMRDKDCGVVPIIDDARRVIGIVTDRDLAIRAIAARMPTYITLKDVKKRWGHGQEDVFPVTQFEKLWVDMTSLPEIESRFVVVPRMRGQQLKDQAQLDGWLRDGSSKYVESLCEWE